MCNLVVYHGPGSHGCCFACAGHGLQKHFPDESEMKAIIGEMKDAVTAGNQQSAIRLY